jgi:hypothetical protein
MVALDTLGSDLARLIADLGDGGGQIGASIYDTAQVLRFCPPHDGIEQIVQWLLAQQQADGGWGMPELPVTRVIPTLAAVLALHQSKPSKILSTAIDAGLAFFNRQILFDVEPLPLDVPVAVELILPRLLEEARLVGFPVDDFKCRALLRLGDQRRQLIAALRPGGGSTAAFSWEAWGEAPLPSMMSVNGSVGNSPAATAAWCQKAMGIPELAPMVSRARKYLQLASGTTGSDIPGIYPTAWPIDRFEQAFGLYALLMGDLLNHPLLADAVGLQTERLALALTDQGLGFSDVFGADGDNTAAAFAVLSLTDHNVDHQVLRRFARSSHFVTYPKELQPSITVTARAVHALSLVDLDEAAWLEYLVSTQQEDGRWPGDKWNKSWVYTLSHAVFALRTANYPATIDRAVSALMTYQLDSGGWGTCGAANRVETAYAILTLCALFRDGRLDSRAVTALVRAARWLAKSVNDYEAPDQELWLNKQTYSVPRIDRTFILSALMAVYESGLIEDWEREVVVASA